MTTQNLKSENKGKVIFITFSNTKRTQWNRFRRYAF